MQTKIKERKGFTLLELLLVVAAIAILAGVVIVALNPGKQLGETRDAERQSDVNTILNGVYQYSIDKNGEFPANINDDATDVQVIGTCTGDPACESATSTIAAECVDLDTALTSTYLADVPIDPRYGNAKDTQYYVNKDTDDRITVGACQPEQKTTIKVTR